MAYNTTTGSINTVTTSGAITETIVSFDLATTDGINYQNCTVSVDLEINGNVNGQYGYISSQTALVLRGADNASMVGSVVNVISPIASTELIEAMVVLNITGTVISAIATGVAGYDIDWRCELKLRIN